MEVLASVPLVRTVRAVYLPLRLSLPRLVNQMLFDITTCIGSTYGDFDTLQSISSSYKTGSQSKQLKKCIITPITLMLRVVSHILGLDKRRINLRRLNCNFLPGLNFLQ